MSARLRRLTASMCSREPGRGPANSGASGPGVVGCFGRESIMERVTGTGSWGNDRQVKRLRDTFESLPGGEERLVRACLLMLAGEMGGDWNKAAEWVEMVMEDAKRIAGMCGGDVRCQEQWNGAAVAERLRMVVTRELQLVGDGSGKVIEVERAA